MTLIFDHLTSPQVIHAKLYMECELSMAFHSKVTSQDVTERMECSAYRSFCLNIINVS